MAGQRGQRRQAAGQPHIAAVEVEAIVLDYVPGGIYGDPHREHRDRPVVQALGVRRLHLVDGVPLGDVEILERVTLAREVVKHVPVRIEAPVARVVRRVSVSLACLPGGQREKRIYCYPMTPIDEATRESLQALLEEEGGGVTVAEDPGVLSEAAESRGLPGRIISVPRTPIRYRDLTDLARGNLEDALRKLIGSSEEVFVEFFNLAGPINIRLHSIELLRGVGKKLLRTLLSSRPFSSLEEVRKVLKVDPVEALVGKILEEYRGEAKYHLFVEPEDPSTPFFNYMDKMWRSYIEKRRAARSQQ